MFLRLISYFADIYIVVQKIKIALGFLLMQKDAFPLLLLFGSGHIYYRIESIFKNLAIAETFI